MLDLLIRGGHVVTPQGAGSWDIGVEGERIALVGAAGSLPAAGRVIEAAGKIVARAASIPIPTWRTRS